MRRALFFALLAWLPIAVWAAFKGRAVPGMVDELLLQHFGIRFRFLVAVPLLIIREGMAHRLTAQLIPYFLASGLVREEQRGAFREALQGIARLRHSTHPCIIIAAVIVACPVFGPSAVSNHELVWAAEGQSARSIEVPIQDMLLKLLTSLA